jgi:hypothetical protein
MAAGDSPTSTSNLALAMLSEDPISNVNPPDNTKSGRLCAQFYDSSRRAMLEAAPWRCAKRQAQLAAAATVPLFTYGAAYPLPADYIRSFELPEDGGAVWEIMNLAGIGPCLVTNLGGPLDHTYIFDLQDCTQMSALLVKTIAADMAVNMALPLSRDLSLKQQCEADREGYISLARTASAQQASPRRLDADTMLRSRW